MSQPLLHLSDSAIVDQMQENLTAYFRIFAGLPGVTFVEEDVTWIVTTAGAPGNHVLRTRISGDVIDLRIDEVINQIGQYTDQIDWLVFPGCQPANLGHRLATRGVADGPDGRWTLVGEIGGPGGIWMLADLTSLSNTRSLPANFRVEYVSDKAMLEEWKQISAEGFGGDVQIYYDAYARHGFGPDAYSLHYIGYLDDEPVTSSTLLFAGGIASVYDVSTPTLLRRQGFGSAITFAMMQEGQKWGYRSAWIWSSSMGEGVYRKFGFVTADFGIREYQWKKR